MQIEGTEREFLEKAETEEKAYNWKKAAQLYDQSINFYLDKDKIEKAAEIYKKIGFANGRAVDTSATAEEYLEHVNNAINAYKEAEIIYKRKKTKSCELECRAEALFFGGFIKKTVNEAKTAFKMARDLFNESRKLYSKQKDQENVIRIFTRELAALYFHIYFNNNKNDIEQAYDFIDDNFSTELEPYGYNIQYIAEHMFYATTIGFLYTNIIDFKYDELIWQTIQRDSLIYEKIINLKLLNECNDFRSLGMLYFSVGFTKCSIGYIDIKDEREQWQIIEEGLEFLRKALIFTRKCGDKFLIIYNIFWLDWFSLYSGRLYSSYKKMQRRILNDVDELLKYKNIYSDFTSIPVYYANLLPTFYYSVVAQMKLFTMRQKKAFAEKAIEYGKESLKISSLLPSSTWSYLMLTNSYSQLTYLSKKGAAREEYAKKMLESANQAEKLGENYEGGFARSTSYSSKQKAYKTLADISENLEDRIKFLTIAADASKKYMQHPTDSRTGIIEAQIRLGLLYEELGILSKKSETLIQAKQIFFNANKECQERGYHSFAAATCEYIARIEDRLGNNTDSAEYYEKARVVYEKSLENIEYEPLQIRVKEKMEYANAWSLIENAKAYHKKEMHLEAKESYNNACSVLKELPSYNYEATYYSAWACQEEAEQLSKEDKHEEAIGQFEQSGKTFNEISKVLEEVSKKSKDKLETSRIAKLEKVAKLRVKYCSGRADIENARILSKQGNHLDAAEKFAKAASKFKDICNIYKIKYERDELNAVYYLCRAWESMELAEQYEDSDRFAEAANQFSKASDLFTDSKMKMLSSGNGAFCQALEYGCEFDKESEAKIKAGIYPKVKSMLRKAASTYGKGGFEKEADWALATSTYFDAAWSLIKADEILEFEQRKELLRVGSGYLKSAGDLFGKTGYKDKEREVLKRLDMVEKEEKILFSALNSIKNPAISSSTAGIIAPACPLETSQSPRIGEIRQFSNESERVLAKGLGDSVDIYECGTNLNILHLSDIQEGRFGIKEDISEVSESYVHFLADLKDKLEILHRKDKIDIIVISGDLTSIGAKEEFDHLMNEFLPILEDVFLKGAHVVPKNRWIVVPGNHDVEWEKEDARFNNFIQFCQENGFQEYELNNPESIYSRFVCRDKLTGNTIGIIALNSCLDIYGEKSPNISNISNSYFSSFSKDWDFAFRDMPKLMVTHHTLHSIKKDRFNNALNKLSDNNVLLDLAGDIHKSESRADVISNIRCIPAGTVLAKKTERQVGIDEVSRQFNLVNLNLHDGLVNWSTYIFEGNWREIKNESFYLEHPSFSQRIE